MLTPALVSLRGAFPSCWRVLARGAPGSAPIVAPDPRALGQRGVGIPVPRLMGALDVDTIVGARVSVLLKSQGQVGVEAVRIQWWFCHQ